MGCNKLFVVVGVFQVGCLHGSSAKEFADFDTIFGEKLLGLTST